MPTVQEELDAAPPEKPDWLALHYHLASGLTPNGQRRLDARVFEFTEHLPTAPAYRQYHGAPQHPLPRPAPRIEVDLATLTRARRSARSFAEREVSQETLSALLHLSYGVTGEISSDQHARAIPSAGALYPLEIFALASAVEDLPAGVYHYRVAHHALELLDASGVPERRAALAEWGFPRAPLVLVAAAVFDRSMLKYAERGYRFALLEAGAWSQQATVVAEALGLRSCLVGGWFDVTLNRWLGLDGIGEAALTCLAVGHPTA